jgi:hypothetical protein
MNLGNRFENSVPVTHVGAGRIPSLARFFPDTLAPGPHIFRCMRDCPEIIILDK